MGNEDFGLAKKFLAGAGVREFLPEGSHCDEKYKRGDNRWRNSSKEEQAQVLQRLQIVLSRPLTEDCKKYLPASSPLGMKLIVLDEQEQKLFTYLLQGGRRGPYGDDLVIYLGAYTERRPDKKATLLIRRDLFHPQVSC